MESLLHIIDILLEIIKALLCFWTAVIAIKISRKSHLRSAIWTFCAAGYAMGSLYFLLEIINYIWPYHFKELSLDQLNLVIAIIAPLNFIIFTLGFIGSLPGQQKYFMIPIKVVIFIIFVQFMVISSITWIFLLYPTAESTFTKERINSIHTIGYYEAAEIELKIQKKIDLLKKATKNEEILKCFLATSDDKNKHCSSEVFTNTDNLFKLVNLNLEPIALLATNGVILSNTSKESEISNIDSMFVNQIFANDLAYYLVPDNLYEQAYFLVGNAIYNDDEIIGALITKFNPQEIYSSVKNNTTTYDTLNTYLINADNDVISPTHFEDSINVSNRVENENTRECQKDLLQKMQLSSNNLYEHIINETYITKTKLGKPVISTHYAIPSMDACLIIEISEREVLKIAQAKLLPPVIIATIFIVFLMIFYLLLTDELWSKQESIHSQ